jgi:hypothetical protein
MIRQDGLDCTRRESDRRAQNFWCYLLEISKRAIARTCFAQLERSETSRVFSKNIASSGVAFRPRMEHREGYRPKRRIVSRWRLAKDLLVFRKEKSWIRLRITARKRFVIKSDCVDLTEETLIMHQRQVEERLLHQRNLEIVSVCDRSGYNFKGSCVVNMRTKII